MQLGPFILERELGRGGMGTVWRAIHATEGVPVAVKVDLHPPAPESTAAFLHEVQIVAALDHPNVVMVLDHGVVDAEVQRATGGGLRQGSRWLAMELAGGGTASDQPPAGWAEVRHLARGLLDGLAHAHARGVVHRDIKPANALLAGSEASVAAVPASLLDARVVLSDFGIAERRDHTALRTEDSVGTPQFMAPEQIEGRYRDQGPWTDLYAMGVLLWKLSTGAYPFRGTNAFQIFRQHLYERPGAFNPAFPVPEGLEALCRGLLGKTPAERPAFAAEARRALDALGEPVDRGPAPPIQAPPDADDAVTEAQPTLSSTRGYGGRARTRGPGGAPLLHEGRRSNVQMHGAGLALFGLRTAPFVGREAECERLWGALVAVRTDARARAVVVRGPSGIGASRLAEWLATRAHELGIAGTLRAVQAPGAAPGAGLVAMLARELGVEDLEGEELDQRLLDRLGEGALDRRALARLFAPGEGRAPAGAELRQLALATLSALTVDRPSVLVLEDAHLDLEALAFVDALLTVQALAPRPILVLITARDDELADHADAEELLDELALDPHVEGLRLGPLEGEGRRALVRGMLGLDGALAHTVEDRTGGNPLFVHQLLGAWVEAGVLVPGPRGFRLADGRSPTIPPDLGGVWRARLDAALAGRSPEQIEALQVAAALGPQVEHAAWEAICALLDLRAPGGLVADLLKRHLVHADDTERWRFSHALLRDELAGRARQDGRWRDHHLAAAVFLRERGGARALDLARHLLEAEVWDEAIEPLFLAIADQIESGDLRSAELLDRQAQVLGALAIQPPHPLWIRLEVARANRLRARGELEEAEVHAERAVADAAGYAHEAPRALREAARILVARADFERALPRALEAERGFLAQGDVERAADCSYTVAEILTATGRTAEAAERMLRCIQVFERSGPEFLYQPLLGMAMLEHRRGDLEATGLWLARCRAHAEPLGLQWTLANVANLEGELARARGDLEAAGANYREAAERYQALESPDFAFPLLNLCILDLQAERWEVAAHRLHPLRVHLARRANPLVQAYADMVAMVAHAGRAELDEAEQALDRLWVQVQRIGLVDPDVADLAQRAGGLLAGAGRGPAAERAWELARAQLVACGRPDDASRIGNPA